jgi:hypothetical protein
VRKPDNKERKKERKKERQPWQALQYIPIHKGFVRNKNTKKERNKTCNARTLKALW